MASTLAQETSQFLIPTQTEMKQLKVLIVGVCLVECFTELVGLVVLSLALLISLCLNVIFCVRRTASFCRGGCWHRHTSEGESPSQNEGRYFHDLNHHEQQLDPNNHCEEQENPIYGNISTDRTDVCYEMMTMKPARDRLKSPESDLNYASLDLKMAKKRKKKYRNQQGQGRNKQDRLSVHLTHPMNAFMEVEADMDAHLPPRDTSTMVSHSSIYLNSQQIAQETEDMERERSINIETESMGWEEIRRQEDGESREWKEEQESEERTDRQNNGSVCTQLPQLEAIQSDTDHLIGNFSLDTDQQD
ncbi:uncharacterized protein LOC128370914 [Scomber japonicus]|uniref:uncharacterized protein LOC128370914 n=1 Tax=Scomber japonicus TaxID=13676 RepID=UPI002305F4C1|nr:uncharacterized protein LOC128370914 [Scomber japonicus]